MRENARKLSENDVQVSLTPHHRIIGVGESAVVSNLLSPVGPRRCVGVRGTPSLDSFKKSISTFHFSISIETHIVLASFTVHRSPT